MSPRKFWQRVTEIRLAAMFCVRDYSWHDLPRSNGLDETLEIAVNGHVHAIADSAGLPAYVDGKSMCGVGRVARFRLSQGRVRAWGQRNHLPHNGPQGQEARRLSLPAAIDTSVPGGNS